MEIRQIAGYHIFEQIGKSISGEVFKAWDNKQQRPAAIKILRQPPSPELFRDYLSTTKALIHVHHPNLCGIYEVGQTDDETYIIMELIDGMNLKEIILHRKQGQYDFLDVALQLTHGLKVIHDMKLFHGNIKPSNIIVADNGDVKLLDAGLSVFKNFQQDPEFVAPYEPYHFLSPEHILSRQITAKSDLFSLGTVLFQFASGSLPFSGRNEDTLSEAILNFNPDFPDLRQKGVSGAQILLIEKLLAKDPEERLTSTGELLITLKEISSFKRDQEKLESLTHPPQNPRSYLSIAVLIALLLIFWYVVTSFKH